MYHQNQAQTYGSDVLRGPHEIVHLEYSAETLSAKPSEEWTRFVCISDTHSRTFSVPDGDVLLHGGDLTNTGTVADFKKTMEWLSSLPHKVKIIIAGNHDLTLHADWYDREYTRWHGRLGKQNLKPIMDMLKSKWADDGRIVYLQDQQHTFKVKENGRQWSVYGSPWSPEFHNWAFNYLRQDGEKLVSNFPRTDILLTHGPPYGILDRTISREDVGCEALTERLRELRPRLHLFGHIHEAHGAYIHPWDPSKAYPPPRIQNGDPAMFESPSRTDVPSSTDITERTVFVNGANWPMGQRAYRDGVRAHFGGPGFQPVVVDLKD